MKDKLKTVLRNTGISLLISIVLIFCILGTVVFTVAQKVSNEMSDSAVQNLSESLDLIKCTIEAILRSEADFQTMMARELAAVADPEEYIQSYERNRTMVKLSLIMSGQTQGVSNVDEVFSPADLDFSAGRTINGLPVSQSYLNYMGAWSYTIKCPVEKDGQEMATLYVEYTYDSLDKSLPDGFYNSQATLYVMDAESERFVLKPKGMGKRSAGHLNLADFYRANNIVDQQLRDEVEECLQTGQNILFSHNIRGENALSYMWAVNDGSVFLVGYVPFEAIQQEGRTVNQYILIVVVVMMVAFGLCCFIYFLNEQQQNKIRQEREAEREVHNKQLAEALQAAQIANNSKTMFLSNMSHDIRTPMNAVLGFARLLDIDAENPDKVREYTKKIMSSGQHLLGLINDVLDVSKIESGKVVLTFDKFTLADLLSAVETIVQPMAKAKKQHFHTEVLGVKYEYLIGDETRLNQILINLLSNAIKYTPTGGNIWFRIKELKQRSSQYEYIRIEVEDNGYGMTPEFLETIFEAFTRAENSTTNKVQGTGLGMAITKSIVELMGGTIDVTSELNKGTLFKVELELRIADDQEAPSPENGLAEAENNSLAGLHFLAAEDNEINAEILLEILDIEDASCEIAENGQMAVERFEQSALGEFDAILMDVQMPIMNGYEATRAIRALPRADASSIPIIAMTANAFAEDEKAALESGMNAHVAKPIDVDWLKKVIRQYTKREE